MKGVKEACVCQSEANVRLRRVQRVGNEQTRQVREGSDVRIPATLSQSEKGRTGLRWNQSSCSEKA